MMLSFEANAEDHIAFLAWLMLTESETPRIPLSFATLSVSFHRPPCSTCHCQAINSFKRKTGFDFYDIIPSPILNRWPL